MKHYKVIAHPKTFENADLLINSKDFPDLKVDNIVEIYHPEDEFSRLLLRVTTIKEDLPKDTISLEQSIANIFHLKTFSDVFVNKVNYDSVVLDSVEVTFKDQYLGRSEMWRLKNCLVNTCVYLNKKIEFCGGTARVQVHEMWSRGERVACGVISGETKVVFRSSTSMVYLFIQMSSEMWEFDVHGNLYFEKSVNGFLADLFQKWKKNSSNHEVTIVLFSRVFYKASSIEEFPDHMRECLQKDYKNQFYEDFYRVAVQNEKYEDWSSTLILLQSLFTEYSKAVLEYHKKPGCKVPNAFLSTAAHGNFLEVLNISLNVFEKHFLERSLDRTGQLSVVISPGVGVFEVDRELTNVTKQRIIDNGVGCDLLCVGEQPLHAVPLFKFHNKDTTIMRDDYSMPHWINLSFYSTDRKLAYSKFVPRIRLPSRRTKPSNSHGPLLPTNSKSKLPTASVDETSLLGGSVSTVDVNYDEYDDHVFTSPSSHIASVQKLFNRSKKQSFCHDGKLAKWKLSDPDIYRSCLSSSCGALITGVCRSSSMATSDSRSISTVFPRISSNYFEYDRFRNSDALAEDDFGYMFDVTGNSVGSSVVSVPCVTQKNTLPTHSPNGTVSALCPGGRALINPFDPSRVTVKVTSNRRRWTHIFPKGPTGVIIQQHHYQPISLQETYFSRKPFALTDHESGSGAEEDSALSGCSTATECRTRSKTSIFVGSPNGSGVLPIRKTQTLLWGATGEQQWSPDLMIGVDWKSLTIPACLPITTDYFPDNVCLQTDYVFSDYNLLPDDVNADYARKRAIYREPLKTREVFLELISQRLAQGFQLIVDSEVDINSNQNSSTVVSKGPSKDTLTEFKLSIGRIFHKISLCKSEIRITRYRPKHPYPPFVIQYRYRFQAPDHLTYGTSWVSFNAEKLENFNWNYLDHYICTRGDTDFSLIESCKYWRFRLCALPSVQPGTKRILDGSTQCNVYLRPSFEDKRALLDGFLKFIESPVNKIRRMPVQKLQQKDHLTNQLIHRRHSTGIVFLTRSQAGSGSVYSSPSRERLGSINREKPFRPRSGSKILDKQRVSPATDIITPLTGSIDLDKDNNDVFDNNFKATKPKEVVTNVELIEMMSHPHYGVGFLSVYQSLPTNTFISYDAVQWLKKNIDGISDESEAVQLFEDLRKDGLICHASGDSDHPFIFGFYLYYILRKEDGKQSKKKGEYGEPIRDLVTFKNEWAEVETLLISSNCDPCPEFLQNELPNINNAISTSELWSVPPYKQTHLEVDTTSKSDRIEWGHAKYQSVYSVEQAFELVIEWVAASGSMISDLIHSLARKAQSHNLQLVPVPADPHPLPYALKSDPLRGPVFVPLDITCLVDSSGTLFKEYGEESRSRRLLLLQEEIAIQFGFISFKGGSELYRYHNQYVHLTGNVFLLIPLSLKRESFTYSRPKISQVDGLFSSLRNVSGSATIPENNEMVVSPHQEYISRHIFDYHDDNYKAEKRVGYLWSWNHMIGRRWKGTNSATNDEAFQDKLLLDFRNFCSNIDNRLKDFWDKCYLSKSKYTPDN